MNSRKIILIAGAIITGSIAFLLFSRKQTNTGILQENPLPLLSQGAGTAAQDVPGSLESLKKRIFPGSEITIEETLEAGANYSRYIASYLSDGLKIYGLLTVSSSPKPETGFPVIVFLHGFVNPKTYVTTADYVASQDGLARNGFITYKPDLRGHGKSEGMASGAHFSNDYVIDTLNAIASIKQYKDADPSKIGIWGHSNGGEIGLRTLVISTEPKAAVFWAGVVGSYPDMLETYNEKIPFMRQSPAELFPKFGSPSANPGYWNKLDPYTYLDNITTPVQLHQGTADHQVPPELSEHLERALKEKGKSVELYEYPGADHNFQGQAFGTAMQRTVEFFRKYL